MTTDRPATLLLSYSEAVGSSLPLLPILGNLLPLAKSTAFSFSRNKNFISLIVFSSSKTFRSTGDERRSWEGVSRKREKVQKKTCEEAGGARWRKMRAFTFRY